MGSFRKKDVKPGDPVQCVVAIAIGLFGPQTCVSSVKRPTITSVMVQLQLELILIDRNSLLRSVDYIAKIEYLEIGFT